MVVQGFRRLRNLRYAMVSITIVATLGGIVWMTVDAARAGVVAGALSLLIAAGTLVLDVVDLLRPGKPAIDIDEVADELARAVEDQWRTEASARGLRSTSVLPLRWSATGPVADQIASMMPEVSGRPLRAKLDGGIPDEFEEALTELAADYERIVSGRLVLLGDPGSGKTVLALLLTLGLSVSRPAGRVPVLLSVSDWDPVLEEPEKWLISTLAAIYYNGQTDLPRELLESDRLIPVLDGLDEIPEASRRVAVEKINVMVRRNRPVVITCRTNEYADSIADGAAALSRAPLIQVQPVAADDLVTYLANQHWPPVTTWHAVTTRIRREPTGPLASAFSTPLTISLARLVYQRLPERPDELLDGERFDSRHAIEDSLAARTVRAAYADVDVDVDMAARAEHFLTMLARYMHEYRERDFAWWKLATRRLSLWTGPTIGITGGLILMMTIAAVAAWLGPPTVSVDSTLTFGAYMGGLLAVLVTVVWLAGVSRPGRISLRVAESGKRLTAGFRAGVVIVAIPMVPTLLALALAISIAGNWSFNRIEIYVAAISATFAVAILLGCAVASQRWLDAEQGPATAIDPGTTLRLDRGLSIAAAVVGGVIVGGLLAPAVAGGLWLGSLAEDVLTDSSGWPGVMDPTLLWGARWWDVTERYAPSPAILVAVLAVLPGLLVMILTLLSRSWPRYVIAVGVLALRREIPFRLSRFLADAQRRGILRRSAGTYQFRHVRLQEQLVTGTPMSRNGESPKLSWFRSSGRLSPARTAAVGLIALLVTAILVTELPRNTATTVVRGTYPEQFTTIPFGNENTLGRIAYETSFSPRGGLLALSGGDKRTTRVYSNEGELRAEFDFAADNVARVRLLFSPDERFMFAQGYSSRGAVGSLWDAQNGDKLHDFALGGDPREGAAFRFTEDSRHLVVTTPEVANQQRPAEVVVWDTVTRSEVFRQQTTSTELGEGNSVLTTPRSGRTELRRIADGRVLHVFAGSSAEHTPFFVGKHSEFVTYDTDRDGLRLWDAQSGDLLIDAGRARGADLFIGAKLSPDSETAVVLHSDNTIRVWDLRGRPARQIAQTSVIQGEVLSFVADFNHDLIAALDADGGIHRWALNGTAIVGRRLPAAPGDHINISPDGHHVVVTGNENGVTYFRDTGPAMQDFQLANFQNGTVGLRTAWESDENRYQIYRLTDGSLLTSFEGSLAETQVNLGIDNVAIAERDGTSTIRDLSSGRVKARLPAHVSLSEAVDLGETFAVSVPDGSIEIRSKNNAGCVGVLLGHSDQVAYLEASPGMDLLASSSTDGTVRLWRLPPRLDRDACPD